MGWVNPLTKHSTTLAVTVLRQSALYSRATSCTQSPCRHMLALPFEAPSSRFWLRDATKLWAADPLRLLHGQPEAAQALYAAIFHCPQPTIGTKRTRREEPPQLQRIPPRDAALLAALQQMLGVPCRQLPWVTPCMGRGGGAGGCSAGADCHSAWVILQVMHGCLSR